MGPVQAIRTGIAKSFQFSGRASRSEFWGFAPVAAVPPLLAASQLNWYVVHPFGIWRLGLLMLASVPLLAARLRRLQDTGEAGHQIMFPFMPFIILWISYMVFLGVVFMFAHLAFTPIVIVAILLLIVLMPLLAVALFASVLLTGSVIGMMLVASQPGPNKYGPNLAQGA